MEMDHLVPEAQGGLTEEGNLWLACSACNTFKGGRTRVLDPLTGEIVPLFNPRQQRWEEHFVWTVAGDYIIGQTAIGRSRDSLFLWALRTYRKSRRQYPLLFRQPEHAHLAVVRLRSPRAACDWLAGITMQAAPASAEQQAPGDTTAGTKG
jgi:hypothetical protein